jgi:hypothetical protein
MEVKSRVQNLFQPKQDYAYATATDASIRALPLLFQNQFSLAPRGGLPRPRLPSWVWMADGNQGGVDERLQQGSSTSSVDSSHLELPSICRLE